MGKPKFSKKKYETPSHPWQEDRIKSENELIKKYGLKNKREIWKAETALRKYRGQARGLLAKVGTSDSQSKRESDQLLTHLNRMSILPPNSNLDDVLALDTESILSRRLQTLTYLKGLANTPEQARQLISHGHIAINNKRVNVPSYMVTKKEEGDIGYTDDSPLNDLMHPARPRADGYKPMPPKKDKKPEEKKEETDEEPVEKSKEDEPKKEESKEEISHEGKETSSEDIKEEIKDEKPVEQKEEPSDKPEETPVEDKDSKAENQKDEISTEPESPIQEKPVETSEETKVEEGAKEEDKNEDKKPQENKEGGN